MHLQNFKGTGNNKIFSVGISNLEVVFLRTCYSKQPASCTVHSKMHPRAEISDELPQQAQQPTPSPPQFQDFFISELFERYDTRKTGHAKPVLFLLCRKSRMSWLFRAWEKLTKVRTTLSVDFSGFHTRPKTRPIKTSKWVIAAPSWHSHPVSLTRTRWWFGKCACTRHSRKYNVWEKHSGRQNRLPGVRQVQLLSAGCLFQPVKCCCKWKMKHCMKPCQNG